MTPAPTVTAVVPTHHRATLLERAVRSVLWQTFADFELVVVIDGADPASERLLAAIGDPRLRVFVHDVAHGAGAARNTGVQHACGEWVAFLDDDDEWLPEKLERQLDAIFESRIDEPLAFHSVIARGSSDEVVPRRPPRPEEHVSEYLFSRSGFLGGQGTIGTSTLMTRTSLLRRIPFDSALPRHQDADLILRAAAAEATLLYCGGPYSIFHTPAGRSTITARYAADWRFSLEWIRARRRLVTPRAYSSFLLTKTVGAAAAAGYRRAGWEIWREARRNGQPRATDLAVFGAKMLLPERVRSRLRRVLALGRLGRSANGPAGEPSRGTTDEDLPGRRIDETVR